MTEQEHNNRQFARELAELCLYCNELQRLKTLLDESVGVPADLISVDKSLSRIRLEMEEQI